MPKPTIQLFNVATGENTEREMTDDEYAALLALGWKEQDESENQNP